MDALNYIDMITPERYQRLKYVIEHRQPSLTVVLENIYDPHNLSAVLRSCDAVGVYKVCLLYHSGQVPPKLNQTSSASANRWVQTEYFTSVDSCYQSLREQGFKIFSTHLNSESISLYNIDFTLPSALVFGNEHSGVSKEATEQADANFIIPQVGMIKSLNISVAAAVSLYEAFRQRNSSSMYDSPKFSEVDQCNILGHWASFNRNKIKNITG
ncbi:MAG: RNA methyltransferase [Candidatus Kapabacteria bacterium]|nr:RNA methyltransferase [Candidatus Kapabacteria bacterium]